MYVYERTYLYVPAVEAAAPTVFMVWQLARSCIVLRIVVSLRNRRETRP